VIAYFKDENSKWSLVPKENYYRRKGIGGGGGRSRRLSARQDEAVALQMKIYGMC